MDNELLKIGNYEYRLTDLIGEGSFGKVYLGRHLENKRLVAIKCFAKERMRKRSLFQSLKNEVDTLKRMKHENVVQFYEIIIGDKEIFMVMEYCNQKDLKSYLKTHKMLSEADAVCFLRQIVAAFKELCRKNIIHRDLKPANLLLHENKLKIADFGFARFVSEEVTNYNKVLVSIVGTPLYMSPQLLAKEHYTTKSDIWSIGIIFYEMCFGKVPWLAKDPQSYLKNILSTPPPIDRKINSISIEAEDFIIQCLRIKESERMGWQEMFNHSLVRDPADLTTEETPAEFVEDESNVEAKVQSYNSKRISAHPKLLASGLEDSRNHFVFRSNGVKPPEKEVNLRISAPAGSANNSSINKMKPEEIKSHDNSNANHIANGNGQRTKEFGKKYEASPQEESPTYGVAPRLLNGAAENRNSGNTINSPLKIFTNQDNPQNGLDDHANYAINERSSKLNTMSYDLKANIELKDAEKIMNDCRAIILTFWEFLTILEDGSSLFRFLPPEKYKLNFLCVRFLGLFVESCLETFKKIMQSNALRILEDPQQIKKVTKILEVFEKDTVVVKEMEAQIKRSIMTIGNDISIEEKDQDVILKFFTKYCGSTNYKELENEIVKLSLKACTPLKDLILKNKLDVVLKELKEEELFGIFPYLLAFLPRTYFELYE